MTTASPFAQVLPAFRLTGRTALVTGAGAGIGAAIAAALSEAGADVILVSRSQGDLEAVAARIRAAGGRVEVRECDVTNSSAIRSVIAELPQLDIVVNNAGTNVPEPFLEVSDEHLDFMSNLNVRACFVVAQAAVRKMLEDPARKEKSGVVINVSSQMGHVGSPNRTVYCMNKHAVEGLTKAMAVELAPVGIRVNSIGPTFVDTPLIRKIVDTPEKYQFLVSKIPMGQMARAEDIAAAAIYLASPAAAMVTGTCLLVDGGWTAQ
ncbi:SDR family NAD(P)-dependent oxidoreductase [Bradyrhizobium sp. PRIMUS42]|uniref:SDR family NAD(P)-dependent oxidoreductase n=1 Tax=Bradyrhizobium sp. PRIMUS42 TaxID=2908926 RepID=UPI001FF4E5FC|nr:glucose 1-dehydrogenase [Bradyrhizobium sp. PRIMUS42]MCJ9728685.1 glucose 1-dehydrogenase [Bradyrhizobium sp. PRIMUS42]